MRAPLPELSAQQRQDALTRAIEVRRFRAAVRDDVAKGRRSLSDVVKAAQVHDDEGDMLARMPVRALLESLPNIGPQRARAALEDVGIASNRRLRGLGERQAAELAARFELR